MTNKKSYPEELFERRLQRYRARRRTKLPHQVEQETCQRAARPAAGVIAARVSADDLLRTPREHTAAGYQGLPADLFDTWIQHDAISGHAVLRGRCGSIVLDDTTCIVELARFLLTRLQQESCGECTLCRIGTVRLREMLERICGGTGNPDDVDTLEQLAAEIRDASLCEVGTMSAQVVLSTLGFARTAYEEHIRTGTCRQGVCACSGALGDAHQ
jgi:hypothetical protein